jgi:GAF domain-containing protein
MLPDFRVRQRDYLLEIARALTEELDLDTLLGRILTISIEMLAGQAGLIALRDESREWRVAASQGIHPAFLRYLEPWLTKMADRQAANDVVIGEINLYRQPGSADRGRAASGGAPTGYRCDFHLSQLPRLVLKG